MLSSCFVSCLRVYFIITHMHTCHTTLHDRREVLRIVKAELIIGH